MPWQRHVADVVLEIDPATGLLAYPEWGLTVPRQSGKSTFLLVKAAHRCLAGEFFGPRQKILYTAQTRQKAREKFLDDFEPFLTRLGQSRVKPYWYSGSEHFRFANRSKFAIEANTEKAGHGSTVDEAYIDEAFAQVDNRLEQAFRPAMITRRNTQIGWISTAGWLDGSPFLQAKVKRGRERAEMGLRDGLAYFEWSAPDDADPSDPAGWWLCMPALGVQHRDGTGITEAAIAAEYESMELPDFCRAYLNRWVPRAAGEEWNLVAQAAWSALLDPSSHLPDGAPFALALDVSPARSSAALAVVGARSDDLLHGEVIDHREGVGWVVPRVVEVAERWQPAAIVVDERGPAGSLIEELRRAGVEVTVPTFRDVTGAAARFYDACQPDVAALRHRGQGPLDEALAGAVKRDVGDAWLLDRRKPSADITPLVALVLAMWGRESATPDDDPIWMQVF